MKTFIISFLIAFTVTLIPFVFYWVHWYKKIKREDREFRERVKRNSEEWEKKLQYYEDMVSK